jgi:glycine cleavage system pyridoxal-binding protein P
MLDTIGLRTAEDLVSYLPADVRFDRRLAIEDGKSEFEIVDYFRAKATSPASWAQASIITTGPSWWTPSFRAASS